MNGPPVDLSFQDVWIISDAVDLEPHVGLRPPELNSEQKHLTRSLRLCYNHIEDLDGLPDLMTHFLAEPSKLGWLDLSFNEMTRIEKILGELPELRVLYLHNNDLSILRDVERLEKLKFLHTLTLHGNPLTQDKGYRRYVISVLPQLKKIDFSAVTREERVLANLRPRRNNRVPTESDRPQVTQQ